MREPVFFVSPHGDDRSNGLAPDRSAAGGPFATLARARDAVRALPAGHGPVTIYLRGGQHALRETLVFTPADGGTVEAPVTYGAYPGETPVISGGVRLTGWRPGTINGHAAWVTQAPAGPVRQLFVRGTRRQRPRLPGAGFYRIADLPGWTPETPWDTGQSQFIAHPGEMRAWANLAEVEVVALGRWVASRLQVADVEEASGLVRTLQTSIFSLIDVTEERANEFARYYVENVREALEEPGTWYLDRAEGLLYYLPLDGEDPATDEVIAPVLAQLIRLQGTPDRPVGHLHFRDLTFAHTEWRATPETPLFRGDSGAGDAGDAQADVSVPGAVAAEYAEACVWERCAFAHLGTYGLALERGARRCRVLACDCADLGAGGIKLGTQEVADAPISGGHTVSDCRIHDGGVIFHAAVGLWMGQTGRNRITHNEICHLYYSGISAGWTWGYEESGSLDNLFAYNHIHHLGRGWLSDMGGIYTLGISTGTHIHHNYIHDVESYGYGGWALYHDEGSSGILSEHNLLTRCKSSLFHQHFGEGNVLRNNILACARVSQIALTRAEPHRSFTFEGNIVYFAEGRLLHGPWNEAQVAFARNLYWHADHAEIDFDGASFAHWQARGYDRDSRIADPAFADPAHGDFTLAPDSPAHALGFAPLDLSTLGPRRPAGPQA